MTLIFKRTYHAESLMDLQEDIEFAISQNYDLPKDEYGFPRGNFEVTITWLPEDVDIPPE